MIITFRIFVWLGGIRGGVEGRLPPTHKIRIGTNCETSHDDTGKFTVLLLKNRSCKYMEAMYDDSDYIITSYTCQAGVKTKMTVGMFLCMIQKGEMCSVRTIPVSLMKKRNVV